jgi:flavodoxin
MYQVLCYSRSGNTNKLADVIANELKTGAEDVRTSSLNAEAELVFLGSGCYVGKPGREMARFIASNDFQGRKVALFGTSGSGIGKEVTGMAETLRQKGATIPGCYYCKGPSFPLFRKDHPDKEDLDGARRFAREMSGLQ